MKKPLSGPYRVGVTSSLGAGKSTLLKLAQKYGFPIIDTDALTHQLLNSPNPAYDAVIAEFSNINLVIVQGGPIDRPRLAAIVFADRTARKRLEKIMHPAVIALSDQQLAALPETAIVIEENPLLFEANLQDRYDETLTLLVNPEVQMKRLLTRPGMTEEYATARIQSQMSQVEKAKKASYVIDNSGALEKFEAAVVVYFEAVKERALNKETLRAQSKDDKISPWDCEPTKDRPTDCFPPVEIVPVPLPVDPPNDKDNGQKGKPVVTGNIPDAPKPTNPTVPAPTEPAPTEPVATVPAPTDPVKAPDATPVVTPPAPVSTEADEATAKAENARFQDVFRTMGSTVTEQALEKLGDVGKTKHKEATAAMSLNVGTSEPGKQPTKETELQVDMRMSIKRNGGNGITGCSCGCTSNCRWGCACTADCGCNCPPPLPAPVRRHWCSRNGNVAAVAIVALGLGFLALIALMWANSHPHLNGNGGNTTVIVQPANPNPVVSPPPTTPAIPPAPMQCGACAGAGARGTIVPSRPFPNAPVCATGTTVENLVKIPDFAFQSTPNAVRMRVANWTVTIAGGCSSASVVGTDSAGKLVTQQQYGANLVFVYRWDVLYGNGRTQVDRTETYNEFIGRSVYVYDAAGKVTSLQQFDGQNRLVTTATVSANAVAIQRFDAITGRAVDAQSYDNAGANAVLSQNFYLFETFNH